MVNDSILDKFESNSIRTPALTTPQLMEVGAGRGACRQAAGLQASCIKISCTGKLHKTTNNVLNLKGKMPRLTGNLPRLTCKLLQFLS